MIGILVMVSKRAGKLLATKVVIFHISSRARVCDLIPCVFYISSPFFWPLLSSYTIMKVVSGSEAPSPLSYVFFSSRIESMNMLSFGSLFQIRFAPPRSRSSNSTFKSSNNRGVLHFFPAPTPACGRSRLDIINQFADCQAQTRISLRDSTIARFAKSGY